MTKAEKARLFAMLLLEIADLPPAAIDYIARVEELAGVPVSMVSVGPQRDATLTR